MFDGDSPNFDILDTGFKRKKTRNATNALSPPKDGDDDWDAQFTASDEDFTPKTRKRDRARKPLPQKPKSKQFSYATLDLDRQCGVMMDNGMPCPRSLACKNHQLHMKRAVTGRSMPYDELVQRTADYSRRGSVASATVDTPPENKLSLPGKPMIDTSGNNLKSQGYVKTLDMETFEQTYKKIIHEPRKKNLSRYATRLVLSRSLS